MYYNLHCAGCIQCDVKNVYLCFLPSLRNNQISVEGARELGDALKVNTILKSLK